MIAGCVCIVIIFVLMAMVFFRAKKRSYALVSLLLAMLPLTHILVSIFGEGIASTINVSYKIVVIMLNFLAFVVSTGLIIVVADKFPNHKQRKLSVVVSTIYSLILFAILVFRG